MVNNKSMNLFQNHLNVHIILKCKCISWHHKTEQTKNVSSFRIAIVLNLVTLVINNT